MNRIPTAVRAGFLPLDNISATDRLTAVANDTLAF
nr:MAG TPA: nucleoporin [Microviridae sp.]